MKLIIIGRLKKNTNGCANISIPLEESKLIDYNRDYVVIIELNALVDKRLVKTGRVSKIILKTV